jgi:hypothetical protein
MVTDLPARPSLSLVTTDSDDRQGEASHPVRDNDGDHRRCGRCGFTFPVDEPPRAEPGLWVCPPCAVASLGGGSLQQQTFRTDGSLTERTVFRR